MATPEELLVALGERLGMATPEPDEEGVVTLLVDGDLPIFMQFAEDGVLMFAGIGTVAPEDAGDACRALLESNHFWAETGGFTLSLIPSTLNVMLTGRERLGQLDGAGFFDLFDRFVSAADVWKARLPTIADDAPGTVIRQEIAAADQEVDDPATHLSQLI